MSSKLPRVQVTDVLRRALEDDGYDVDDYLRYFGNWKANWPANEYEDPFFGKDGDYREPKRNGKMVLRHVHLPPEADQKKASIWDYLARKKKRKKSDTALVYAYDKTYGYLLIAILQEPDGHKLADMKTQESKELMEGFADIADRFIMTGTSLV